MGAAAVGGLDLRAFRPKRWLMLRLMYDGGWKWITLLGLLMALVAASFALGGAWLTARELRYKQHGKTAKARVTWVWRRGTEADVRYEFEAEDGREYKGAGTLPPSHVELPVRVGDLIVIEYLASDPNENRPVGTGMAIVCWACFASALVFAGLGLFGLVPVARHAAKVARLLRHGKLARATIFERPRLHPLTPQHPADIVPVFGGLLYAVRYWFTLPDGTTQTARDLVMDLGFYQRRDAGATIALVYLPEKPRRSAVFRKHWTRYLEKRGAA